MGWSMWTPGSAAVPGNIVAAWALAGLVAGVVTFVGWWRRGSLDLKWDASLIVLGCVGACLLWSALQSRRSGACRCQPRLVIRSAHGQVSVPRFQDAVPR